MVMPNGVSGGELGTRLRAEHPDLRVIYTSGYSIDLVGREVELREGYNFLQKPYPPRKLVQTVRQLLDSGEG
jgi:two-component system cell cycle sensor histidine kinase/response regulator CckA